MSRRTKAASEIIAQTKVDTISALTDVVRLQQSVIDHLYLVISSVDAELVDEHTLRQMKRAAQISDFYT